MKVKELIELLSKEDPEKKVYFREKNGCGEYYEIEVWSVLWDIIDWVYINE